MAGDGSSKLIALCSLVSFFWLSYSLDRHSLIEKPRLSAFLLLSISGAIAFLAGTFSKHLPGADGRFNSGAALQGQQLLLQQRPRRFYVPCVVCLIVIRLEICHRVLYDLQCTVQAVESFLPVLLAAHEYLFSRNIRHESDELEDMWGSAWEDFKAWMKHSKATLIFSTVLFSYGAFLAADFAPKSSYFCSALVDNTSWVVLLQWVGILIDAVILIFLWRVLLWARTIKTRLRTLGGLLITSALATGTLWVISRLFRDRSILRGQSFRTLDSLFVFDVLSIGVVCAVLILSFSLWVCEYGPLRPTAIVTFMIGATTSIRRSLLAATYQQTAILLPLAFCVTSVGFLLFTWTSKMPTIVYVPRVLLVLALSCIMVASTMSSLFWIRPLGRHPVDELIYGNRIEADRWLRYATVSTTLRLAVSEYKERYHGRDPPVGFDKWYDFALQRNSVIIDRFDQIEKDILPFWGMEQTKIRDGLEIVKTLSDVGIIKVVEGKAYHNQPADSSQKMILDEAVSMISSFAEHLPDLSMAINLRERPRILVPWDDIHRLADTASRPGRPGLKLLSSSLNQRQADDLNPLDVPLASPEGSPPKTLTTPGTAPYVSAEEFRHLQTLACPPGSKTRSRVHWNTRDLCTSCADPHSQGHFLRDWEKQLDPCHQPDIFHLHEFHAVPHEFDLHQHLLPLFSRSKTDSFNDILIPLIRPNTSQEPDSQPFYKKKSDSLFWQSKPSTQPLTHLSLHGGHRNRLVHLINKPANSDKMTMLLALGTKTDNIFAYEEVSVSQANRPLPLSVSYIAPASCHEQASCQHALREFGFENQSAALDHRYALLLDTADGPPPDLLSTLRSNSVPVLSSVFREWFTERLMPWVHFVPIDVRYHGLHSTMAYFFGLKGRGRINGLEQVMTGGLKDAEWIAEQGRKWTGRAVRREDMEVYLFRLLLEYGRVVSDDRDALGFSLELEV